MTQQEARKAVSNSFRRRAKRVAMTKKLVFELVDLHSPIENQYWQSYYCCRELKQEGQSLTAKYCNKRWCFECNAIRAAKMINGYKPVFDKMKAVQFVTLTRPNVPGEKLLEEVTDLIHTFELTIRHLRERQKLDLHGVRKLEITYNHHAKTFHPHFHILVDGLTNSNMLVNEWLYRNQSAVKEAQNIKKADDGSFIELFKYATKAIVTKNIPSSSKDIIFQAITGKRIYQAFGIKKHVPEDLESLVKQDFGMLEPNTYKIWIFNDEAKTWFDSYDKIIRQDLIDAVQGFPTNNFNTS